MGHVAVADALCYVFGAFGVIWVCGNLGPRLLKLDLRKEAEQLERQLGIEPQPPQLGLGLAAIRAARLPRHARGIQGLERRRGTRAQRASGAALRRAAAPRRADPRRGAEPRAAGGDVVAVSGPREALVDLGTKGLAEVEDRELLDLPVSAYDVFLTAKDLDGQTVAELANRAQELRGVYLRKIVRNGQEVPIGPGTVLERGDVVRLVGPEATLAQVAKRVGAVVSPTDVTDFRVMGLAIVVGALVGILAAVDISGFKLSLGSSVGVLLAGIVVGCIRGRRPLFGRIPDAAISFMQSIGLSGFVAMVGIGAGPHFMPAIREAGLGLFFGGVIVTLVPQIAGLYFGRYVLKVNPLLLLGGLAGAQTFTPGLAAVQEKSGSPIAVLGYSGSVAIAHVLLPMWGAVIVALMSGNVVVPPG